MAFLDKNGLQTLTNKLVQGDAIKVASHRGHTVKNVIDNITRECENVATPNTMTLENRVNEFKVGKGRDIDVSGDVEEGKVEVELKGKTWQNVVHGTKSVQSNIFTIEDGKYVFNNNATSSGGIIFSLICKPNTTYTLIINFLECALGDNNIYIDGHPVYLSTINRNLPKTKGTHAISFVTKDDVTDKKMKLAILSSSTSKLVIDENIIVLEGDYTQTPVEELPNYFEGIKSSFEDGVVDVEVTGKNLWSYENQLTFDVVSIPSIGLEQGVYKITSSNITGQKHNDSPYINFVDSKGDTISATSLEKGTVIINRDVAKIVLYSNGFDYLNSVGKFVTFGNFQLEKVPNKTFNPTPYEPYYKKKISFNIGESLRSLPNGVCDEIRNNNGQWELIRKIGKVVLNGSEGWNLGLGSSGWNVNGNTLPFYAYFIDDKKVNGHSLTDLFTTSTGATIVGSDVESFSLGNSNYITIRLKRGKLLTEDANGFKKWLSQNPTTVYYELKTPIITPIEPMEFDVKPLATMTINSDIAPVSNHKVVLNRAGQIEQGIIQIAELKSRVDSLETAYDSYLLETQHKLSILGFEYELESEEI